MAFHLESHVDKESNICSCVVRVSLGTPSLTEDRTFELVIRIVGNQQKWDTLRPERSGGG